MSTIMLQALEGDHVVLERNVDESNFDDRMDYWKEQYPDDGYVYYIEGEYAPAADAYFFFAT